MAGKPGESNEQNTGKIKKVNEKFKLIPEKIQSLWIADIFYKTGENDLISVKNIQDYLKHDSKEPDFEGLLPNAEYLNGHFCRKHKEEFDHTADNTVGSAMMATLAAEQGFPNDKTQLEEFFKNPVYLYDDEDENKPLKMDLKRIHYFYNNGRVIKDQDSIMLAALVMESRLFSRNDKEDLLKKLMRISSFSAEKEIFSMYKASKDFLPNALDDKDAVMKQLVKALAGRPDSKGKRTHYMIGFQMADRVPGRNNKLTLVNRGNGQWYVVNPFGFITYRGTLYLLNNLSFLCEKKDVKKGKANADHLEYIKEDRPALKKKFPENNYFKLGHYDISKIRNVIILDKTQEQQLNHMEDCWMKEKNGEKKAQLKKSWEEAKTFCETMKKRNSEGNPDHGKYWRDNRIQLQSEDSEKTAMAGDKKDTKDSLNRIKEAIKDYRRYMVHGFVSGDNDQEKATVNLYFSENSLIDKLYRELPLGSFFLRLNNGRKSDSQTDVKMKSERVTPANADYMATVILPQKAYKSFYRWMASQGSELVMDYPEKNQNAELCKKEYGAYLANILESGNYGYEVRKTVEKEESTSKSDKKGRSL